MKRQRFLMVFLCMIGIQAGIRAQQQEEVLTIHSGQLTAGQQTTITYKSELTNLNNEENIEGIIYFWDRYQWTAEDLALTRDTAGWNSRIYIPEETSLVFFKFHANGKTDTGGEATYGQFVFDSDGRNLPSGYTGWGLARGLHTQKYGIPSYITDSAFLIRDDVLLYWFNQELRFFPKERKHIFLYAAETLNRMGLNDQFREQILGDVYYVLNQDSIETVPEENYVKCTHILRNIIRNDSLANVVEEKTLQQYPNGMIARDKEILRLFRMTDENLKEKELESFLKRFPTGTFMNVKTETSDLYYGKVFQSVIYGQVMRNNNYDPLYAYIHDLPSEFLPTFFWHMIQVPYTNKQLTASQVRPHADLIMNEIMTRPQRDDQKVYSPKEWKRRIYEDHKDAFLAYAKILDETGDVKESLNHLRTLSPYFDYKSADFNDFHIRILEKSGDTGEILSILEKSIANNAATPEMLNRYKQIYIAENGNETGFDEKINLLKSADLVREQQQRLKDELINKPIQLFELEQLDGGTIDMNALKGKIIVLDLWATWCAPCIAAMPGMQMAVNKYKDDPAVVFLFVSTQEFAPDYKEKIKALMKEKGYDFNVVLDSKRPGSKTADLLYDTYTKAFGFSGIPQKMIIDGNGMLRWRSTGYKGSPSELADEISYLIGLLKEEK